MGLVVRIIDERVGMSFDPALPGDITVRADTDLNETFAEVADRAYTQKIETLLIMSHGFYETGSDGHHYYGFGIELGRQNLKLDTVEGLMGRLAGKFAGATRGIELRGCGVAVKSTVRQGPRQAVVVKVGDGIALCQKIADVCGTGVLASSDEQPGDCGVVRLTGTLRNGQALQQVEIVRNQECTLGTWSGKVWLFTPRSTAPSRYLPPR